MRVSCVLLSLALAAVPAREASLLQRAPSEAAGLSNPLETSAQAESAGAKLYGRECAACHGANRLGRGKVPPLNATEVREAPPGALFWVLRHGSPRREMPSFAHLPEAQRWQIVTFLQRVRGQ